MTKIISAFLLMAAGTLVLFFGLFLMFDGQDVSAAGGSNELPCANGQPVNPDGTCPSGGTPSPGGGANPGGATAAPGQTIKLVNPLASDSFTGETGLFQKIFDVLLIFALPIIIFFIMYAGFLYVTARGDTGQISTAHTALQWAIIGGVIVLGAKVISEVIQATILAF